MNAYKQFEISDSPIAEQVRKVGLQRLERKSVDVYEKHWGEKGNGTVPPPRQVPFSRVACETTTHE